MTLIFMIFYDFERGTQMRMIFMIFYDFLKGNADDADCYDLL